MSLTAEEAYKTSIAELAGFLGPKTSKRSRDGDDVAELPPQKKKKLMKKKTLASKKKNTPPGAEDVATLTGNPEIPADTRRMLNQLGIGDDAEQPAPESSRLPLSQSPPTDLVGSQTQMQSDLTASGAPPLNTEAPVEHLIVAHL